MDWLFFQICRSEGVDLEKVCNRGTEGWGNMREGREGSFMAGMSTPSGQGVHCTHTSGQWPLAIVRQRADKRGAEPGAWWLKAG
jgi:hypothetical protein